MGELRTTERGTFVQDACGLWHYRHVRTGHISEAIRDAVAHRPAGAAWFWFNGSPAPMCKGDDFDAIYTRWAEWRNKYQAHGAIALLAAMELMAVQADPRKDGGTDD